MEGDSVLVMGLLRRAPPLQGLPEVHHRVAVGSGDVVPVFLGIT